MTDDASTDAESTESILPEPIRSVTPLTGTHRDREMDVLG